MKYWSPSLSWFLVQKQPIAQVVLPAALANLSIFEPQPTFDLLYGCLGAFLSAVLVLIPSFCPISLPPLPLRSPIAILRRCPPSSYSVPQMTFTDSALRYCTVVDSRHLCLQKARTQPLQRRGGRAQIAWECPLTSLSSISKGFPVPPLQPVDYSSQSW